MWCQAAAGY